MLIKCTDIVCMVNGDDKILQRISYNLLLIGSLDMLLYALISL
uniref:Uncharacterized protein n=1 Tax=Arundo donax TaxID=35708 RepID=A0A0A8ZWH2_ARUDO